MTEKQGESSIKILLEKILKTSTNIIFCTGHKTTTCIDKDTFNNLSGIRNILPGILNNQNK